MVDTIDVFYEFSSYTYYNACYSAIDKIAREKGGQAIHKNGKGKYLTTALANIGVLNFRLFKGKCRYCCYMFLQPARLLHAGTHLRLAKAEDCPEILRRLNEIIASINQIAPHTVLPPIEYWRVSRIDYAVDIETPYVSEYLRLFKAGHIPPSFSDPEPYDGSFYLKSKNGNINFYDKLQEVREKFGLSDEDIIKELNHLPDGLMRLEFQSHNRWILHLKKRFSLADTTLPHLLNPTLAWAELKNRVASIIEEEPFILYDIASDMLSSSYKNRTALRCCQIMRILKDCPEANLDVVQETVSPKKKNDFAQLLHKIRKLGINPIPLDVAYPHARKKGDIVTLPNPCAMIS